MQIDGRNILIVDDDTSIRDSLKEFLSLLGYNVECAGNAEEAMASIRMVSYDVIITDYIMPGMNGLELVKKIRGRGLTPIIIGISGTGNEKDFLAAGANIFINKPLSFKRLQNVLEVTSRF